MNKWILLFVMFGVASLSASAQDDMYFVPSKPKAKSNVVRTIPAVNQRETVCHSGSSRNVDEYNRMGSSYEVLPSDTGDIITFSPEEGVYPDSTQDFSITRKMTRWDDYVPSDDYWDGYAQGRRDSRYSWHSPWYYSSYYPWYDSWYWYDPWYYDPWYYNPWYYSSWGWYDPWYYGSWGWGGYYSWYRPWYNGYYWYGGGGIGYTHHHNAGIGYRGDYHNRPHGVGYSRNSGSVAGTRRGTRFGSGSSTGNSASRSNGSAIGTRRTTLSGSNSNVSDIRNRTTSRIGSGSYSGSYGVGPSSSGSRPTGSFSSGSSSSSSMGTRSSGGGGSFGGGGGSRGGGGGGHSGSSRR